MAESSALNSSHRVAIAGGCAVLLGVLVVAVYYRPLSYGFLKWDDEINVSKNVRLRPLGADSLLYFWRKPYAGLRIPVTYNVLAVVAHFAGEPITKANPTGLNPAWFHATNLALHGICTWLVFLLAWRVSGSAWGAAAGAALFAIHPVQVEPVAWVTGIKDVFSGALALAALLLYLASIDFDEEPQMQATRRQLVQRTIATLLYILALAAKPSVVTLPAIAWVIQMAGMRRPWHQGLGVLAIWLILAGLATQVNKDQQQDDIVLDVAPGWSRPLIAADALAFYAYKLALPLGLGADYGRSPRLVLSQGWLWWTWLVPVGAVVLAGLSRQRRAWWLALLLVALAVSPVLGLVPFGFQLYSTVADRYLYLGMLGPALALAILLSSARRQLLAGALAVFVLALLAVQSFRQTGYWRDDVALFRHVLEAVNPRSFVARNNVGFCLQERGETVEAERLFREAIALRPQYGDALLNLGNIYYDRQDFVPAIEAYRRLIEVDPRHGQGWFNLGNSYSKSGDFAAARDAYRQALAVSLRFRNDPRTHFNLAFAMAELGEPAAAVAEYQLAAKLLPRFFEAHYRAGVLYEGLGRKAEALAEYRQALTINPNSQAVQARLSALAGASSGE
ncbi:MAG: tetratricopeptide repeat protein [Pirellulales bacterium]|nr:tetratricopeptide repeat protein [Pirellulales bacterium]